MTQHDQNQDAQLDDLFAAARRDAPEPSYAFMQALFDTIPEPNAATAVIEEPVSTGWWAGVRQTIADTFATRNIFSDAFALTGVIAAGVFGVWIGVMVGTLGAFPSTRLRPKGLILLIRFQYWT